MSEPVAEGFRLALVHHSVTSDTIVAADGPGVVVFDDQGRHESISPAAEHWIAQMVEHPPPAAPTESKMIQAVAAQARVLAPGADPLGSPRGRARWSASA